jgi:hypothetical protein
MPTTSLNKNRRRKSSNAGFPTGVQAGDVQRLIDADQQTPQPSPLRRRGLVGLFGSFPLYPFCVRAALTDLETTHSLLAQTIDHDRRRVDDIDVEVDGVAIRPRSDVLVRLARRSLEIVSDVLQCDAGQTEAFDLASLEPRRVGETLREQHDLPWLEQGTFSVAATNVGSAPSIPSMRASAIPSSAPSGRARRRVRP